MDVEGEKSWVSAAEAHGLTVIEVERQLARLQAPRSFCFPSHPCTLAQGIRRLLPEERLAFEERGKQLPPSRCLRFIPASGAASRMFKSLLQRDALAMEQLQVRWSEFPFREAAEERGACVTPEDKWHAVMAQLDLPSMPKGALPFHREAGGTWTAFEAQLEEWARTQDEPGRVHFTLPERDHDKWHQLILTHARTRGLKVESSIQHPSTDTMAVAEDGRPFILEDGHPLFRPGGHGALLRNLQVIAQEHRQTLVSIKNIDNVRPTAAHDEVIPWRRTLLGIADALDEQRLSALRALNAGDARPAQEWLRQGPLHPEEVPPSHLDTLKEALDRPLMVAGMVRNEGEPGGGPFWLKDDQGQLRAQIVESSEMDGADPIVRECLSGSTHFNPVDVVCAMHDEQGSAYDLSAFVDQSRDFQVEKSHEGRPLRALEHPGLWNGAMGRWNSVFIEVPAATFAPVKTIFDLLRPAHRSR